MSVLICIPARYASTRYFGTPLVGLRGASGVSRSLVERTWRAAQGVKVEARGRQFWELNIPSDLARIETMMAEMGLE